jgi:hypothetical protein
VQPGRLVLLDPLGLKDQQVQLDLPVLLDQLDPQEPLAQLAQQARQDQPEHKALLAQLE